MAAAPREQLVDCRGDVKLPEFSGRDEDRAAWSIKAHALFALMGCRHRDVGEGLRPLLEVEQEASEWSAYQVTG